MSRELRFSRLRFSYQLIGKFGCMLHNLLLARNLFVLHQDFTITDNGIDTTAVCCIHEIGDKVMIRGKSRDIQIDQTEIRQIAFGNPSGFQPDSAALNISPAGIASGSFRQALPKSEASFIASIISRLLEEEQPSVPKATVTPAFRISQNLN